MEADPSVVLEWLDAKNGDLRDLQLTALEQLCNEVLFSDNVDVFCERYPPRCVLPVLCRIFLDDQAPPMVLEANARAVSYYLDMELEWCNYITHHNDVMSALASHLECVDMSSTKSNEFGQQLLKLLKIICTYDANPLYSNGGLTAVLRFVRSNASLLHTDVLQAGMELIRCLLNKADPKDPSLQTWIQMLSSLLDFKEPTVVDQTLRAFANLVSRFTKLGADPTPLADPHIVDRLLHRLCVAGGVETTSTQITETVASTTDSPSVGLPLESTVTSDARDNVSTTVESNPAVVHAITNILVTLCCASSKLTHSLLATDGQFATTLAMLLQRSEDESVVLSILRLINILLVLLFQNPSEPTKLQSLMSEVLNDATEEAIPPNLSRPATPTSTLDEAKGEDVKATSSEKPVNESTSTPDQVGEASSTSPLPTDRDILHRPIIEAIKRQDLEFLRTSLTESSVDVNYTDHLGQTLLNWAASFGSPAMVHLLCDRGANVHQGVRSPLDYAATFGRVDVCRALLARGADPNQRDVHGLRPIDRARDHLPYPGCQQVIDLLELESKRLSNRNTCAKSPSTPTPATRDPPRIEVIGAEGESTNAEQTVGTRHAFVNRLFPVVVDLFDHTSSPVVKRQCFLLVRRMAIFMPSEQLEKISLIQSQTLPFSFLLTQLIYNVFIEETDEYVLRALELSHCLLVKAPSVYISAFYRLGLVPLIKQLGEIWSNLVPAEKPVVPPTELGITTEEQTLLNQPPDESITVKPEEPTSDEAAILHPSEMPLASAVRLNSNQFYSWHDWNLIWIGDLLSVFNRFAFVIIQLHVTDGCLRALAIHTGSAHERIPVVLQPGEPAVERPSLKQHMFRMHQHLVTACDKAEKTELWAVEPKPEPVPTDDPLSSRGITNSPVKKSNVGKSNLHRLGLHLGLRRPPDPPYDPKDKSGRTRVKSALQRQASSPARVCISSRPFVGHSRDTQADVRRVSNVAIIGPVICSLRQVLHGTRLCLQMRHPSIPLSPSSSQAAPVSEALLFSEECDSGFSRVRISPLYCDTPPSATTAPTGATNSEELESSGVSRTERNRVMPSRRLSISLSTLLSELDSELHSDGSNSSQDTHVVSAETPELYDFDLLFGLKRKPSNVEDSILSLGGTEPISPETDRELQRLDELLFPRELVCETYSSGPLSNWLRGDSEYLRAECKDQQERAKQRIQNTRKQAIKLSTAIYVLLQSTEEITDRATFRMSYRCNLDKLRSIVESIWHAFFADKSSQSTVTLRSLSTVFTQLADLLSLGEEAVTAYELLVSGLVPSLLLCLSVEYADRWNCPILPIGLDATTSLLWYLRERRRIFVQSLIPTTGSGCLSGLIKRLVQAFELTEHLPLRLYSLVSNANPGNQSSGDDADGTEAATPSPSKSCHSPPCMSVPNRDLVSLPLGVIRKANNSFPNHDSLLPKNLHECQQFTDCIDEIELSVIPTLCSQLFSRSDEGDSNVPWVRQVEGRLPLELELLHTGKNKTDSKQCLTDWSSANIRANPLVTVSQLERFILRMSTKQWFESPRTSLPFWSQLERAAGKGIVFSPPMNVTASTDCFGGVVDWMATNAGTLPFDDWANPGFVGLLTVVSSAGNRAAYILGPRAGALIGNYPVRCTGFGAIARPRRNSDFSAGATPTDKNQCKFSVNPSLVSSQELKAWFVVDLGLQLLPTAYSLAYLRQAEVSATPVAPRNWNLEASNDAINWIVLRSHVNDTSIQSQSGSRGTWTIDLSTSKPSKLDSTDTEKERGWRFFKIQSTGPNANNDGELALGGLDFYGTVYSAHETVLTAHELTQKMNSNGSKYKEFSGLAKPPPFPSSVDILHGRRRTSSRGGTITNSDTTPIDERKADRESSSDATTSPSEAAEVLQPNVDDSSSKQKPEPMSPTTNDDDELEEEDLDDEDDVAVAEDTSQSSTISRRLLESLGLLDNEEPFLQYLLLSPDQPADSLRRLLRSIRTQDATDEDEAISPKPITRSTDSTMNKEQRDKEGSVTKEGSLKTAQVSNSQIAYTPIESVEELRPHKAFSTASVVAGHGDGNAHESLWFIDQEQSTDAFGRQFQSSDAFDQAAEDADALEFAEVVEAIIESNISNNTQPFADRLSAVLTSTGTTNASIKKDQYERVLEASDNECPPLLPQAALPRTNKQEQQEGTKEASKHSWFSKLQDDQGVVSDPELSSEPSSQVYNRTTKSPTTRRGVITRHSHTEESMNPTRTLLRQMSLTSKSDVKKSTRGLETQDDQCKLPASAHISSRSGRQQRRRPRRPRPRPIVQSSSTLEPSVVHLKAANTPTSDKALTWDEAVETLRLPNGLIPAFNPYPGYTNAPATTLFVLCNAPTDTRSDCSGSGITDVSKKHRLSLYLFVMHDSECVAKILLKDRDSTLFSYIQQAYEILRELRKPDKQRSNDKVYKLKLAYRYWSPEDDMELQHRDRLHNKDGFSFLKWSDLRLTPSPQPGISYSSGEVHVTMVTDDIKIQPSTILPEQESDQVPQVPTTPENLLNLLGIFYQLSEIELPSWVPRPAGDLRSLVDPLTRTSTPIGRRKRNRSTQSLLDIANSVDAEDFISKRLTKKLIRQLHDPMALATGTLPPWCFNLTRWLRPLFTFTARLELLRASGFGPARSVHWLQNQPLAKILRTQPMLDRSYSAGSSSSNGNPTVIRLGTSSNARTILLSSLLNNAEQCPSFSIRSAPVASDMVVLRPSTLTRVINSNAASSGPPLIDDASVDTPFLDVLVSTLSGNTRPNENRELWNCLLSRAVRANVVNGAQNDAKTHQVGRLHKEFVRIPRLPREIIDSTERPGVHLPEKESSSAIRSGNRTHLIGASFWDWAARLMDEHASRKAELEIQFIGEDGTGLGPTLEFYSLLAAELRRRDGLMWVTDDSVYTPYETFEDGPAMPTVASVATLDSQSQLGEASLTLAPSERSIDLGIEANAYVNTAHGLFPAAWPGDRVPEEVLYRFYIMGIAVAKCLQDNRRIDLPLSPPMLKLLTAYGSVATRPASVSSSPDSSGSVSDAELNMEVKPSRANFSRLGALERSSSHLLVRPTNPEDPNADIGKFLLSSNYRRLCKAATDRSSSTELHWLAYLLDLDDFCLVYPERAEFFRKILEFCGQKYLLTLQAGPHNLDPIKLERLAVEIFGCNLEDMCIGMEFLPTSSLFGTSGFPLSDRYSWEEDPSVVQSVSPTFNLDETQRDVEPVTIYNIESFLTRTLDFALDKGIRKQLDMFKAGFERVLPLSWLALFNGTELGELIGGDSSAHWTREDLLAYTVPCFGFTNQSPTYRMLINVLSNFDLPERRAFLQFTTGCSSLPPGGLKNLHPRLRVVRKEAGSGAFPSVNTCVHYLKLPEYNSEHELRSVLLRATREVGFYLN